MATSSKPFLQGIFDPVASEDAAEDTGLLPGQQPVKPAVRQSKPVAQSATVQPAQQPARRLPTAADVASRALDLGVDPQLALSIFRKESSGNFNSKDSPKGAIGGMQVMSGTYAQMMGTSDGQRDPWNNMEAGLRYIAHGQKVLGTTDPVLLAAGYHAGYGREELKRGEIPDTNDGIMSTRAYAQKVAGGARKNASGASQQYIPLTDDEINELTAAGKIPAAGGYVPLSDAEVAQLKLPSLVQPKPATTQEGSGFTGFITDVGKNLKVGANTAALDLRELVGKIPGVGPSIVEAGDAVDRYFHPPTMSDLVTGKPVKDSADLLKRDTEQMVKGMTPEMQAALQKKWWDSDKGTFGDAWKDPRSYLSGVVQSLPEQAMTMGPAMGLAKAAYASKIAAGAAPAAAAAAAARSAAVAGALSEGALGGAQSSREVREKVMELPQATLDQSEAYQSLLASGMNQTQARAALAGDLSTRAFITSGVITGIFGGMGDRAIARVFTEQVGKGVVQRAVSGFGKGAVAEGLLEELPQSAGQQVAQNEALRQANPQQSLTEDVANQALGGAVLGGLQGGGMGSVAGAANSNRAPEAQPGAAAPAATPSDATPPAGPVQTTPVSTPSTAPGMMTRAMEDAAENHAGQPSRVTVTAPEGQVSGQLQAYQEDADGNFVAQIVGDDGQVVTLDSRTGVQITPEATPEAGPMSAALAAAAEDGAAAQAEPQNAPQNIPEIIPAEGAPAPEQVTAPTTETAAPVESAAQEVPTLAPDAIDAAVEKVAAERPRSLKEQLSGMELPALQERLAYIADQAKASGGWTKMFVDARNAVQREIRKREKEMTNAQVRAGDTSVAGELVDAGDAGRIASAAKAERNQPAGRARTAQPVDGRAADSAAPVSATGPAVPGEGAPAVEQPALTGFTSELDARQALAKQKLGKTHQVIERAPGQFELAPQAAKVPKTKAVKQQPTRKADKLAAAEAKAAKQEDAIAQAVEKAAQRHAASKANGGWMIREKATGNVVMETFDQKKVDALNTEKYEAVPTLQHLQELNDPNSLARRAAESTTAAPTKGAKNEEVQAVSAWQEASASTSEEAGQGADVLKPKAKQEPRRKKAKAVTTGATDPTTAAASVVSSVAPVVVEKGAPAAEAQISGKKEPWQMSAKEWAGARNDVRPNVAQSNFTKGSGSEAVSNIRRLQDLLFGVRDAARQRLEDAKAGKIKLSRDEVDDLLDQINTPVSHRDVVAKAVAEGRPVPVEVLAEYPDLNTSDAPAAETRPAKPKQEPRRKKAKAEPVVMDEETYLATNGASRQKIGEAALHRSSERKSEKTHRKQVEAQARKDRDLIVQRARLREEYQAKVAAGEIRPPSAKEEVIAKANGHPDLDSTQAARRIAERRGWEWRREDAEPAMSVAGDDIASAIDRLMTDKAGEAKVNVPGLGEVTIPYGDSKAGLAHIARRRGADFIKRLPDLLANGKVYEKGNQKGRVFIGNDRDEAVVSLTRDGENNTWLLSAYERYPDLKESRRSEVTEDRMPEGKFFTKDDLRKSLTSNGVLGQVIASMIDSGIIVLHGGPTKLPGGTGRRVKGVQAVTMPDGTIHMVASNLTPRTAMPVLLHEMFHQGGEKLIGTKEWGNLMGRLGSLYRQSEQSSGKAREFYDRARARVEAARKKGAVGRAMEVEEFAAYAIEEYEKDPSSLPAAIRKWVEDLIGLVKTWMVKNYGKQIGAVTPAQLAAMARWALMDVAVERRGEMFGPLGEVFSAGEEKTIEVDGKRRPITNSEGDLIAEDMNQQLNFYRWFKDSEVVDSSGHPKVMYHGSSGKIGSFVGNKYRGGTISFTYDIGTARDYADGAVFVKQERARKTGVPTDAKITIEQVYLSVQKLFDGSIASHRDQVITELEKAGAKAPEYYGTWDATLKAQPDDVMETDEVIDAMKSAGFDGQWVSDSGTGQLAINVFSPSQVKSVENTGAFSTEDTDIRFSASADQTDTPAFKRWFGDSKVVDENGAPLVMYHGTNADFSEFNVGGANTAYFAYDSQVASDHADYMEGQYGGAAQVMPVYLSVQNPKIMDGDLSSYIGYDAAEIQKFKDQGHDGIVSDDRHEVIVFDKSQIKSAIGNTGNFDPDNADIRYSVADDTETESATGAPKQKDGYTPPEQGRFSRLQAAVQDNMNRVKQVQARIMKMTGRTTLGKADYYGAETNRPGRIAARLEDFREGMFQPLIEKLAKAGYKPEQLQELLHAQHAKERNEAVARINPEHDPASGEYTGTQGSGMNDDAAEAILQNYADQPKLLALAQEARDIARATLDLKLAYGLIKPADHELLTTMYENYIPLKGDGEYGPKIKRATGHGEREEHILENIARDYEQATVAGEKNLARQSLLQMVLKFADPELWTASVPPRGKYVAGKSYSVERNGKSEATFQSLSQVNAFLEAKGAEAANYTVLDNAGERVVEFTKPLQDNEVIVYVNGDPVRLQIHDEALARQLRPLGPAQMNPILEKMRDLNRYLSKIYTGYNPAFIFKNAARDAMTGTINMAGNQGAAVAAKAWGKYPSATKAMFQWAKNKKVPDGKMGAYLNEYRMHGGKTGASYMSDLEQQGQSLQAMFDDARGLAATAKDAGAKRTAALAFRKSVGKLAHVVEIANQTTENALRLALYAALREEGQSPAKAAQAAKTVTVDFDRKGELTGALGAIYLFFNPAVQGTANAMKTLFKGEHRKQAWAALGGLAMLGALAASQGMDEDKDRWLGESWENRTKSFKMNFGGHQFNLPLSQEFAPAYALGVAISEALHGEKPMRSAAHVLTSFLDAYFPLDVAPKNGGDNPLADAAQGVTPTVFKPIAEAAMNRNSFGSQVVPETELTKDRPDNLKMYRGTKGTAYDTAAQAIARGGEALGAGRYENDLTKVSPETLKSLWRTYTGGLGSFVTDSIGAGRTLATGDAGSSDIPIIKDFWREQDVKPLRGRYYDLAREAKQAITEFKQAKKAKDYDEMDRIEADPSKSSLVRLGRMIEATSKQAAELGDEKADVNQSDLPLAEKRAKLKEIEKREEALYREAIDAFKQ